MKHLTTLVFALCLFATLGCVKQTGYDNKNNQSEAPTSNGAPVKPSSEIPVPNNNVTRKALSGIYTGFIELNDNSKVSLQITVTDANLDVPANGQSFQKNMIGAFVIDGEGGRYAFSSFIYDIGNERIDMRYARSVAGLSNLAASPSLYFTGQHDNGTISGLVISGSQGQIGSFSVKKNESIKTLKAISKYRGSWKGTWTTTAGNKIPVTLNLEPSDSIKSNPLDMELEFTPAKSGGMYTEDDKQVYSFANVSIDYFRKNIRMTTYSMGALSASMTFNGVIESNGNVIRGTSESSLRGNTGTFVVTKKEMK